MGIVKVENIIEVKNLVKKYKKAEKPAVDGVSFEVKKGEMFALLGPNGAGKTTVISILTTTLAKTSGEVKIAGLDIEKDSLKIRSQIGIIFQNPSLDLNLTAEENVRFHAVLYGLYPYAPFASWMPEEYRKKLADLAEVLGLTSKDMAKPVRAMSGGMKRKLEIIRSLMHNPKVLFLDEPTTGLDPLSRKSLWTYLDKVRDENGTTILVTTHYLEEIAGADRVCIIKEGKIVAMGSTQEVKKQFASKEHSLEEVYLKIIQETE